MNIKFKIKTNKYNINLFFLFIIISIVLIFISSFRPIGIDRDSLSYKKLIDSYINKGNISLRSKEPTFWLFVNISDLIFYNKVFGVLLFYSILGVGVKIYSIYKLSLRPFLSIVVYICLYFILHEMTQIRVGVASGIFLLSIIDIANKNPRKFLLKLILATLFHYSAIIMAPFYFLNKSKIKLKYYLYLPIIGLVLSLFPHLIRFFLEIIINYFPTFISYKLNTYLGLINSGVHNQINIFNLYYLSLFLIYYFVLINYKKFKSQYDYIYIKILGWLLFLFYSFSFLPILSFRISEFLGLVLIILLPNSIYIFKQKILIYVGIIFYSVGLLYNYIFIQQLIKW